MQPSQCRGVVSDGEDAALLTSVLQARQPDVDRHLNKLEEVVYSSVSDDGTGLWDLDAPRPASEVVTPDPVWARVGPADLARCPCDQQVNGDS